MIVFQWDNNLFKIPSQPLLHKEYYLWSCFNIESVKKWPGGSSHLRENYNSLGMLQELQMGYPCSRTAPFAKSRKYIRTVYNYSVKVDCSKRAPLCRQQQHRDSHSWQQLRPQAVAAILHVCHNPKNAVRPLLWSFLATSRLGDLHFWSYSLYVF